MSPNVKKYLSVIGTTVGGALLSYLAQTLSTSGIPTSADGWEAIGRGAFIAMTAALLHLYQSPPSVTPSIQPEVKP